MLMTLVMMKTTTMAMTYMTRMMMIINTIRFMNMVMMMTMMKITMHRSRNSMRYGSKISRLVMAIRLG